jgi:putative thiamine transport system permease protein
VQHKHQLELTLALLLALLFAVVLVLAMGGALQSAAQVTAWRSLIENPLWPSALGLTVFTGLLSTFGALALSFGLLSAFFPGPRWPSLLRPLSNMLAVPHAAFAIGLVFLLSPSGWLARLVSPWLSGWQEPPALATVQDPWGLGLVLALVLKETPFLLWAAASELQRADSAQRLGRELDVARSMGYARNAAWWRLIAPQLLQRLRWPLLAVLAYGLTVVDMALIIGPASPPTLAVLAWQWLQDADSALQVQGAAAAWVLALALGLVLAGIWLLRRAAAIRSLLSVWMTNGQRGRSNAWAWLWRGVFAIAVLVYVAVMLSLGLGSFSGVWAFPALLPQSWTFAAWASVWDSGGTVLGTAALAALCASLALAWAVAWLECAPAAWDAKLRPFIYLPLVLPAVLWVLGVHAWALRFNFSDSWLGVAVAHSVVVLPYVLIALSPAYQGFDVRYHHAAASMGRSRARFLLSVKWPMLKAALCSAWAVGAAVSVAQYLPTVYLGGGRVSTVTTEAVALAAGAQRSLTAAYAWLQWLIPVAAFSLAAWLGRPRKFAA